MHFVLATETSDVTGLDLYHLAKALEINGRHCAEAYSKVPPAIDVIDDYKQLSHFDDPHPIVFFDHGGDTGVLANHYYDPLRKGPAARVFVHRASGFNNGRNSVAEAASHELVEAMVNPAVNLWADYADPDAPANMQVAYENADPVQTHYEIEVRGTKWKMSNFVTPHWFRQKLSEPDTLFSFLKAGGRFDHSGELEAPGEIGPEGYIVTRTPRDNGGWDRAILNANSSAPMFTAEQNKTDDWSRTQQLVSGKVMG